MRRNVVRSLVAVSLAAVAVTLVPAVRAGEKKEEKKHPGEEYFEGHVSAIDPKAHTITVKKKDGTMAFTCAADCKYYAKEKKAGATFDDFKVGDHVNVL